MKKIISLGHNCHPAYWLTKCNIRTISYPFDWLSNHCNLPCKGLSYVNDNIKNNFKYWLNNLKADINVFSENYPHVKFLHFPDVISNKDTKLKLERRANRFMNVINNKEDVVFLYCYYLKHDNKNNDFNNEQNLIMFKDSILEFLELVPKAKLVVYFVHIGKLLNFKWSYDNCHARLQTYNYIRDEKHMWNPMPDFFKNLI
jgi:hypothetical protein